MDTAELDYELPPDRIATTPAEPRDAARLMVIWRREDRIEHHTVADLHRIPGALQPGDLMIFNQTRVLAAQFTGRRGATGGRVRGLYLSSSGNAEWRLMLEARGKLQPGERIELGDSASNLELIRTLGNGEWSAKVSSPLDTQSLLDQIGTPPLPPYIQNQRRRQGEPDSRPEDVIAYNTVFAADPGSVAAPTAALHFTPGLLKAIDGTGIHRATLTLHIGLGTFAPIRTNAVGEHEMHEEYMTIPAVTIQSLREARASGRTIMPVGTTCVRSIESLSNPLPSDPAGMRGQTNLYIHPDLTASGRFRFRFTDAMMTNFHLPRSSLLALVAALPHVGIDRLKNWYRIAIDEGYRFYSYGDAMLLL